MNRDSKLQDIAREIGLSYAEHIDSLPEYITKNDFLLFSSFNIHRKEGLPTCFKNILTGKAGGFHLFSVDFRNDYSIDKFGYKQTIAILRSNNFSLPKFYLIPVRAERFTVKFEHIGQDIFLPLIKKYKKRQLPGGLRSQYTLKSQEIPPSRHLLTTPFMNYLHDQPQWFIEGSSDALLVYQRGKTIKPSALRAFIDDVLEIGRMLAEENT